MKANNEHPSVMPASSKLRRGSSSSTACFSSSELGLRAPHLTRRRLTNDGWQSRCSSATQRAMSFDTVARGSTFSNSAYRAPTASVRLTHSVRPPA